MKRFISLVVILCLSTFAFTQKKYFTKSGHISFNAGTALEDIDAVNTGATSIFDAGTGQIEYSVQIKGFEFKRALMQEHFNENYLESDKYPKSVFKGRIQEPEKIKFDRDGSYPVLVKGILEIHGIKKDVETTGIMKVKGEMVNGRTEFKVALADYNIDIPGLVRDKISKTVTISVNCNYNVLNK
ncbi:MAG TPA: YceI family protein [Chitinophagaceae bacterium]